MIDIRDIGLKEAIFTHIDDQDHQVDIAIDRLSNATFAACAAGLLKCVQAPVQKQIADYFVSHRGVEQHRLDRLDLKTLSTHPIIFGDWPNGAHMLLDGHHRYVKAYQLGLTQIKAVIVPEPAWRQYEIKNNYRATHDELRTMKSGM
jgi:hypothetical protein